eukprot:TRINITY_DN7885_c0_g1_i1.p1 TRINITY_DN7885_c0_g1~~TRINITY_DN7885_c0_g1_i1.p1  ORF type:complete len:81 (+),score=20.16 TRINITY_DN7885_c0_g1_i1:193-435(+)
MTKSFYSSSLGYNTVLKYRSPVSQRIVTIVLPLFSGLAATLCATKAFAPAEIPINKPSDFAHVLCVDTGRSSETAKAHRG